MTRTVPPVSWTLRRVGVVLFAALVPAVASEAAELAAGVALYKQVDASTYRVSIDLKDTGTTNLGTLWYGWVPGEDFLPVAPTNIVSPAGWTATVTHESANDGFAVQWVNQSGPLTPGAVLSGFGFDIQQTPTQLTGNSTVFPGSAVGTTFVYGGTPFSDAGSQFTILPATAPWQNPFAHTDVTADGQVAPIDALQVINDLLTHGTHAAATPTVANGPAPFLDVNGDNLIAPVDALTVINQLLGATASVSPLVAFPSVATLAPSAVMPLVVPEPEGKWMLVVGGLIVVAGLRFRGRWSRRPSA